MDELKPCPFCGSDEFLMVAHSVLGAHSFWQVECGCHATGAPEFIRADAIREWNERGGENELLSALRELLGSCTRTPVGLGDGGTYVVTGPTMEAIKTASAAVGKYQSAAV